MLRVSYTHDTSAERRLNLSPPPDYTRVVATSYSIDDRVSSVERFIRVYLIFWDHAYG